jgi:Icc-related predicted phosphoesterase
MRIVNISDTHGSHWKVPKLPDGDVLIHAGDFMLSGHVADEIFNFNHWLGMQPHRYKIVIAGNHDILFERQNSFARSLLTNAIYLENSGVEIEGLKFWGSPQQPEFMNWAFNVPRGLPIRRYWDRIPNDTDVLITHGPPVGIRDKIRRNSEHLGCDELLLAVDRVKPKLHIFGHIHGGYGEGSSPFVPNTEFINCALMNEAYHIANNPIVKDLEVSSGK